MIYQTPNGLTVKQLKHILQYWPEIDDNGEEYEVWIGDGDISNQVIEVCTLNENDILLEHEEREPYCIEWCTQRMEE